MLENAVEAFAAMLKCRDEKWVKMPGIFLRDEACGVGMGQGRFIDSPGAYGKAAVPMLIPAVKDREIGWRVMEVLGRIGPDAKAALPAICESIDRWPSHSGTVLDSSAATAIHSLSKDAHAELAQVVKSNKPIVRAFAVTGLIDGSPEVVRLLLEALDDPEPRVREYAAVRLHTIQGGDKIQVVNLRRAIFNANPLVRHFAMRTLFKLDSEAETFLRACLKARKGKDQVIAAGALMELLPKQRGQWMAYLAAQLKNADADMRFESALQLVRPWENVDDGTWREMWARHWHVVVPVLVDRMRDEKAVDRHDAVLALVSLHEAIIPEPSRVAVRKDFAKLMPEFFKALKSNDRRFCLAALHALRIVVPIERKYPPNIVLTDGSGDSSDYHFRADVKTTLPAVVPLLRDPARDIRLAALRVVLTFGPAAAPHLPTLIADPDWEIQSEAFNGLFNRKKSAKQAIPAMRELAKKHERSDCYVFFMDFLAKFDQAESFAYLVGTLAKKNGVLRQALEEAGQKVSTKETVAALKKQLGSPDRDASVRAAYALAAVSKFLPEDDKQQMRAIMIKTLQGKMPKITKAMQSDDARERREAVTLLYDLWSAIGGVQRQRVFGYDDGLENLDPEMTEILEGAFRDPDLEVRRTMRKFLRPARNWTPAG